MALNAILYSHFLMIIPSFYILSYNSTVGRVTFCELGCILLTRRCFMDVAKIGKFIAERRKLLGLTQYELAEKLSITDKAVSKWETGKSLPDHQITLALCDILKISVNDLLNGEVMPMENYNKNQENLLLEVLKEKQKADKRLLNLEIFLVSLTVIVFLSLLAIVAFVQLEEWLKITLIVGGFVLVIVSCLVSLKIEQVAGYYECKKCGHKHVPTYTAVSLALHVNRTRYMKCPNCKKWSWQKKALTKD